MFRLRYLGYLVLPIITIIFIAVAQDNTTENSKPKRVIWDHFGQREILKGERMIYRYENIEPDYTYLKLHPTLPHLGEYEIELTTDADQIKLESIATTQSVSIPDKDSPPEISDKPSKKFTRVVTFTKYGQEELVRTGESVNVTYENVDVPNSFISYRSVEDGYFLTLQKLSDKTPVKFNKLCESFIVRHPSKTLIMIDEKLKYEQVIWTPLENGQWEVRVGTVQQSCPSPALKDLDKLRSPDYLAKRPMLIKK